MALLAIQGHPTRGKEVISLLEMLGGKNDRFKLEGLTENFIYYICPEHNNNIYSAIIPTNQIVFTLEQFEEKFPYKIGDKVWLHYENLDIRVTETITCMHWCDKCNCILYDVSTCCNLRECAFTPYKEETMDRKYNVEEYLKVWEETEKGLEVVVNDNFELKEEKGKFYIIKKQSKYPKTYEECCEILNIHPKPYFTYTWNIEEINVDIALTHHHDNLLNKLDNLRILLICRDAYWKIAGEQMGLGKPWEPDWNDENEFKYGLYHFRNGIMRDGSCINSTLLAFTTEEMRDVFYENFKELIGTCKELL